MKPVAFLCFLLFSFHSLVAQKKQIRVIVITAHPDEAEEYAGGTAALFASMGDAVKFVSLTNGDAGHWKMSKAALAARRLAEAKEAGKILGVDYEVLDNHDGELENTIALRKEVVRMIREWKADIVISFYPAYGEHPDNMNAGRAVQDAASFVTNTPLFLPEVPCLTHPPLYLYMRDFFTYKLPHKPDIVIAIDQTIGKKYAAFGAHASQFYEFAPYQEGYLKEVPGPNEDKKTFFDKYYGNFCLVNPEMRTVLAKWWGKEKAAKIRYAEAFEIAPYSEKPSTAELKTFFPLVN